MAAVSQSMECQNAQRADKTLLTTVINPAERNAIVGIKPTVGLTSRAGYAKLGNIGLHCVRD